MSSCLSSPAIKKSILYLKLLLAIALAFEVLFKQVLFSMFYSLICLLPWLCTIVLHFILSFPRISISGTPNNNGPPPGITKNLHIFVYFCVKWLHYILGNAFKLYMCNTTLLSLILLSYYIIDLGKSILKILRGIKLPSLPVSIL